jgi:hypothetical protein
VKNKSFVQINVLERKKECFGEALIGTKWLISAVS